jgi:diadenosine tetraphosphate (Ap4A) HIT family hydrolase
MKHAAVETPGDDGHIHIIPVYSNDEHEPDQTCWCRPEWQESNRAQWRSGEIDYKVFLHKSDGELRQ